MNTKDQSLQELPLRKCAHFGMFALATSLSLCLFPVTAFADEIILDPYSDEVVSEEAFYTNELVDDTYAEPIFADEASSSSTQTKGDYTFIIDHGSATITAYTGTARDVVIPSTLGGYPVTILAECLFYDNQYIDSVTIPEGVITSSILLFAHSSIKTVNIPSTLKNFALCSFSGCEQLQAINVSADNPKFCSVNGDMYNKNQSLLIFYANGKPDTTFTIPSTVTSVVRGFNNAIHLETLNISDSVQMIEDGGLASPSLKTINIGKSLQYIDGEAFGIGLEQINVDPGNPYLSSENGVLYNKDKTKLIAYPARKWEQKAIFVAPTSVTSVGTYAFSRLGGDPLIIGVRKVVFPSKIDSLEDRAFYNCYHGCIGSLEYVVFRDGINPSNVSPNAMWGSNVLLMGDESVRQAAQVMAESLDFNPAKYINTDLSQAALSIEDQTYNGSPLTPEVVLSDSNILPGNQIKEGRDYLVTFENNILPGQATAFITGVGDFYGSASKTFTIAKADIAGASIYFSNPSIVYAGAPCTPKPTLTWNGIILQEGKDYTLRYVSNDSPSKEGWVYAAGIGSFEGETLCGFEIRYPDNSDDNSINNPDDPGEFGEDDFITGANKLGAWVKDASGWWYRHSDGSYSFNAWAQISGSWYHFNKSGYMQTGWLQEGDKWYYLAPSGSMVTGWVQVGGTWYYMNASGAMQIGWQKIGGAWYYFSGSGAMQIGWQQIGGSWYHFGGSGALQTGWYKVGSSWYYSNTSGAMQANCWIGNYYVTTSGAIATDTWVGEYHVNASGLWDKTA